MSETTRWICIIAVGTFIGAYLAGLALLAVVRASGGVLAF